MPAKDFLFLSSKVVLGYIYYSVCLLGPRNHSSPYRMPPTHSDWPPVRNPDPIYGLPGTLKESHRGLWVETDCSYNDQVLVIRRAQVFLCGNDAFHGSKTSIVALHPVVQVRLPWAHDSYCDTAPCGTRQISMGP